MALDDPRKLLALGQRELTGGDLDRAHAAFEAAAVRFSGPAELLGGGHGWRGVAQVAMARKDWGLATRMFALAERTYGLGSELLGDEEDESTKELRISLLEGRAIIGMLRADLAIRRLRYADARRAIDAVYPLYRQLGDRPSVADLWVTTARLAEREGRWFSSRTAWAQVLRVRKANGDEYGQCDALIRIAEAMIAEDNHDKAEKKLDEAEALARYLEDRTLQGRVHIAVAKILEHEASWEAAWEKWLDADQALRGADPLLRGLSQVRMARTAVRVRPTEANELLEKGLHALLEAHHPDAIGIVLHQCAVVALVNGDSATALLAAVGADRARGGDDGVRGLIVRILLQLGELEAAYLLAYARFRAREEDDRAVMLQLIRSKLDGVPDLDDEKEKRLEERIRKAIDRVITPMARMRGLDVNEVDTRRAATRLTAAHTEHPPMQRMRAADAAPAQPQEKRPVLVWRNQGAEQTYELPDGITTLGRGDGNAVRMGWDPKAAPINTAVEVVGDRVIVRDMGSGVGTRVDGKPITDGVDIRTRPFIVGKTLFRVDWRRPSGGPMGVASIAAPPPTQVRIDASQPPEAEDGPLPVEEGAAAAAAVDTAAEDEPTEEADAPVADAAGADTDEPGADAALGDSDAQGPGDADRDAAAESGDADAAESGDADTDVDEEDPAPDSGDADTDVDEEDPASDSGSDDADAASDSAADDADATSDSDDADAASDAGDSDDAGDSGDEGASAEAGEGDSTDAAGDEASEGEGTSAPDGGDGEPDPAGGTSAPDEGDGDAGDGKKKTGATTGGFSAASFGAVLQKKDDA